MRHWCWCWFFGTGERPAQAQAVRGNTDYLMVSGQTDKTSAAVYMIDQARRRLVGIEPDPNRKGRLVAYRIRKLKDDFEIKEPVE